MREIKFRAWDGQNIRQITAINFFDEYMRVDETPAGNGDILKIKGCDIMQFTNLHDKNGKEIYEGDILQHNGLGPFLVNFDKTIAAFVFNNDDTGHGIWDKSFEIIGNIHQNPELLK